MKSSSSKQRGYVTTGLLGYFPYATLKRHEFAHIYSLLTFICKVL